MVGEMRFELIQRRGNDFTDRLDSPTSTLPYINDFKVSQPPIYFNLDICSLRTGARCWTRTSINGVLNPSL